MVGTRQTLRILGSVEYKVEARSIAQWKRAVAWHTRGPELDPSTIRKKAAHRVTSNLVGDIGFRALGKKRRCHLSSLWKKCFYLTNDTYKDLEPRKSSQGTLGIHR